MDNYYQTEANRRRFSPSAWGRFYLSQGFNSNGIMSNDCGPTSLAMVLNNIVYQSQQRISPIIKIEVIKWLHAWERLPGWLPAIGGATAPWGMVNSFNRYCVKNKLSWRAERQSHANLAIIKQNLEIGNLISALKVWKNGSAHWINIVHFSKNADQIYALDPDPTLVNLPVSKRIYKESWQSFEKDWGRRVWWSRLLNFEKEVIIYYPVRSGMMTA